MTSREQALAAYFYTIATDPRVKAAGYDIYKVKDAIFSCVAEDVPAVFRLAIQGHVER